MKLFELFQQPYEWKEERSSLKGAFYSFTTGEEDYRVRIAVTEDPSEGYKIQFWKLQFRGDLASAPQERITKTGKAFQVFATVVDIVKSFLKKKKDVEIISFEAKEPSRQDLYVRIIKTTANDIGFKLDETTPYGAGKLYILHKKEEK